MEGQNKQEEPNNKIQPKKEQKIFKEEIYDRLPFTYKQVDIFTKIIIGITITFLVFAIIASNM